MKNSIPLWGILLGIYILVLQNAGIIPSVNNVSSLSTAKIPNELSVQPVRIVGAVEITNTVSVNVDNPNDINVKINDVSGDNHPLPVKVVGLKKYATGDWDTLKIDSVTPLKIEPSDPDGIKVYTGSAGIKVFADSLGMKICTDSDGIKVYSDRMGLKVFTDYDGLNVHVQNWPIR